MVSTLVPHALPRLLPRLVDRTKEVATSSSVGTRVLVAGYHTTTCLKPKFASEHCKSAVHGLTLLIHVNLQPRQVDKQLHRLGLLGSGFINRRVSRKS
mmetsp:Transcript_26083/g.69294  ORF Transcript_26083/g.69294 Transcript_26083/m.69294 type:complete len:98 (-) Transcript_26083:44-337(-)